MALGHKWSTVNTYASPGALHGVGAYKNEYVTGPCAGLGYRFSFTRQNRVRTFADVGLNYEPGQLKEIGYKGDDTSLIGPTKAHLETKLGYGLFPDARFGINF